MPRTPINRMPSARTQLGRSLPLRAVVPSRRAASPSAAASGGVTAACTFLDAVVDWARYEGGVRQAPQEFEQACAAARDGDGFLWLGLHDPTAEQLEQLGTVFDLHPLALEDAANTRQRPKIERYEDMLFLAMRTLAYVESDDRAEGGDVVETGSVMVFLAEHAVITVRHGRHASMSACAAARGVADLLRLGPRRSCTRSPTRSSTTTWRSSTR